MLSNFRTSSSAGALNTIHLEASAKSGTAVAPLKTKRVYKKLKSTEDLIGEGGVTKATCIKVMKEMRDKWKKSTLTMLNQIIASLTDFRPSVHTKVVYWCSVGVVARVGVVAG